MATFLVVDDEELVRYSVRLILEEEGHTVEEATNGAEGLVRLGDRGIDAMITDVVMPRMRGLDTIQEAKRRWPTLPIIAMSGSGVKRRPEYLEMAIRAGADAVLAKPFTKEELDEAIAAVL